MLTTNTHKNTFLQLVPGNKHLTAEDRIIRKSHRVKSFTRPDITEIYKIPDSLANPDLLCVLH
uniref:Uncharacterized protein n=1 Tax=Anguilla anguilla TaxID=7936 RepID=A0A0E9WQN4_ANGAN